MPTPLPEYDCFAIVTPGLEPVALAEARALGLPAHEEEGGFAWKGDASSLLRANLSLRIASRVVVRLADFDARSFAELERRARKVEWSRIIQDGDSVRFRVTSRKSKLYHTGGIAQRLGDSITRALPRTKVTTAADDEEADEDSAQLIIVRFVRDHCVISADTSGALLHRRGYRQATTKAPLRETIAAAMIQLSGWTPSSPLIDPFCGSGTIPIEAAMLGSNVPPGLERSFAMERWPGVSRSAGDAVRSELRALKRTAPLAINGSDRDAGAIAASHANAQRAGVLGVLTFEERAISAAPFDGPPGWVISNPPYGVRVGEADGVRDLWARFGQVLRERALGWRVVLLSPDPALERQAGLSFDVLARTSNGGIPVRVITAEVR